MRVVLLTGCNLGDKISNMKAVYNYIDERIGEILETSSLHYSSAWGFESTDDFVNQVIICDTDLSAMDLLNKIWEIERLFGKARGNSFEELKKMEARDKGEIGYMSRSMDIDILFYGEEIYDTALLTIPHRLIRERKFVLEPLYELMPSYCPPGWNCNISEALDRLKLIDK